MVEYEKQSNQSLATDLAVEDAGLVTSVRPSGLSSDSVLGAKRPAHQARKCVGVAYGLDFERHGNRVRRI